MTKATCDISISADGYSAGHNQSEERPFGDDGGDGWGDKLHAWIFETPEENRVGRAANLQAAGAEVDQMAAPGAFVMGRNMFGPVRGEGKGWWATIRHSMLRSSCSRTTRAIRSRWMAAPRSTSSPTESNPR